MPSNYVKSLPAEGRDALSHKLWQIQNQSCYICQDKIDEELHLINATNIDHIVPLANKGKDAEQNFALTHESCNKSKQDANLNVARVLQRLSKIQKKAQDETKKAASLKDVLNFYGGAKHEFTYAIEGNTFQYSFPEISDNSVYKTKIFTDALSQEKTCFIEVPIEYIFHDELINPRGINNSIRKLVKEFEKKNPQLHLSLSRIDNNKIKIFDGQHKAVAQILLGVKKFVIRVFIDPDIEKLTETNTNAGSTLRQIAFDKSIMRQLNNTLYAEKVKKYQEIFGLEESDLSFSEQELVDHFKGDGTNVKKYITDSIKYSITYDNNNKLKDYIDFGGREKGLPISYSAFDKTILSSFVNSKSILATPIDHRTDEGLNPRELEINQIVKLLNILAETIYINKFEPEVGINRIEDNIVRGRGTGISDNHLLAFRISKEEVMQAWISYLRNVIFGYFTNIGKRREGETIEGKQIFQNEFPDQLWTNIENFVKNLTLLPLWKDRSMASNIFAGKNNYAYWETIFSTGKTPDGANVLSSALNFMEMIHSNEG